MPSSKRPSAASTYSSSRKAHNRDLSASSEAGDSEPELTKSAKSSTSKSKSKSKSGSSKRASNARDEDEKSTDDDDDEDSDGEDSEEYEVEAIKGHKFIKGQIHYKTGWKDYPSDQDTWEPEEKFDGAKEILRLYKLKHKHDLKSKSSRASNASNKSSKSKRSRDKAAKDSGEESSVDDSQSTRKRKRTSPEPSKSSIAPLRKNGINGPTKADRESVKNRKQVASDSEPPSDAESIDDQEWHARYKNRATWEGLVRSVRTIEKVEKENDDTSDAGQEGGRSAINVCLLWHTGRTTWVTNQVARAKLPQKLLDFYEDHLQFSTADQPVSPPPTTSA